MQARAVEQAQLTISDGNDAELLQPREHARDRGMRQVQIVGNFLARQGKVQLRHLMSLVDVIPVLVRQELREFMFRIVAPDQQGQRLLLRQLLAQPAFQRACKVRKMPGRFDELRIGKLAHRAIAERRR